MVKKGIAAAGIVLMLHGLAQAAGAGSADAGSAASAAADSGTNSTAQVPAGTWAAQGQLGLIVTSGNTTTKSGNASLDLAHRMGRWTLSGGFAALYASTGPYTTQEDLSANLQADLALSKRTFWFTTLRWDRNLFTGFAYQESVASGAGYNFIATPATQLAGELGVGYRRERPELLTLGPAGNVAIRGCSTDSSGTMSCLPQSVVSDAVLQAGLKYSHAITSSTKVVNTLVVQSGSSDTTTTDNLSVQVKVDASLSLAVGMQLVNNSNPPPGNVKHTDTVVTVNLVYALKNPKLSPTGTAQQLVNDLNLLDLP